VLDVGLVGHAVPIDVLRSLAFRDMWQWICRRLRHVVPLLVRPACGLGVTPLLHGLAELFVGGFKRRRHCFPFSGIWKIAICDIRQADRTVPSFITR
jgi:hypothetical protein